MKIPELFHHLEYFSSDDYTQFEKFLKSPYYNSIKAYGNIFSTIKNHKKYVEKKKYSELKTTIVKETGYSEKTVSKSLSHLSDLCVEFTKTEAHKNEILNSEIIHCNYLLLKGNFNLLDRRASYVESLLSNQIYFDQDIFRHSFDFQKLKYSISHTSKDNLNSLTKLNEQKEFTLESSKNLMVYALAKNTINLFNYFMQCFKDKIMVKKFPVNLEDMYKFTKTHEFNAYNKFQRTTITLFHKLYLLITKPESIKLYQDYKDYYDKVKNLYNDDFRKTNLSILLSFCSNRQTIPKGYDFFTNEVLNLHLEYIEGYNYINDKTKYLHPIIYRNYVLLCKNKDSKPILKKFIQNHTQKLNPDDRENMENYAWAHFHYLNNDLRLSLKFINNLKSPKYYYKLDTYALKTKIFYELNEYSNLEDNIHNFKEYIADIKQITKNDRERHDYLIMCLNKLMKAHKKFDKSGSIIEFEYLLNIISKKSSFVMSKWITEKVKEFIEEYYKSI